MAKNGLSKADTDEDLKNETERDIRTLTDVIEIINDDKRLARVKTMIGTQKQALEAIEKIDSKYLENIGFKKS